LKFASVPAGSVGRIHSLPGQKWHFHHNFNLLNANKVQKDESALPHLFAGVTQKSVLSAPHQFAALTHIPLVADIAAIYDIGLPTNLPLRQGGPMKRVGTIRTTNPKRLTRLQVMLSADELAALEDFRFEKRMPSLAAAIREILRRGLTVDGFNLAGKDLSSSEFGVLERGDGNSADAAATQAGKVQKATIGKPVEPVRANRAKSNGGGR